MGWDGMGWDLGGRTSSCAFIHSALPRACSGQQKSGVPLAVSSSDYTCRSPRQEGAEALGGH